MYRSNEQWFTSVTQEDPTAKIKAKTLKQIKALKDKFSDNKLYYDLKPTGLPAPRSYGQSKMHNLGVPIHHIASYTGSLLHNPNKYIA